MKERVERERENKRDPGKVQKITLQLNYFFNDLSAKIITFS